MFQFKRRLHNNKCLEEETKKFRITYDDKKIISSFENLSNELFYEIFDYLDGYEIYKAFSNLNSRFQVLLISSCLRLKIDLRSLSEPLQQNSAIGIINTNKHQIISLNMTNFDHYDSSLTLFNIDSSFSRLESLVLDDMKSNQLIPLLVSLISLPRLFSLTIYYDDDLKDISNIYQLVFNLPMLNYYKLSFFSFESFIPLSIATSNQFSSIKYLVIDHCCTLDELINTISYTPQLCRLICQQLNESDDNIVKDSLKIIFSLTRISIARCYVVFDELETFLTNVSPQLEVLRIQTFKDVNYLDADRWERIISHYLLHLNIFEFKYEELIDEELESTVYHERLNEFNSLFWIKRQWLFKIYIDTNYWDDNVIIYAISSHRKTPDNSHKDKENDENFINEIDTVNSLIGRKPAGPKVRYAVVGAGSIAQSAFMPGILETTNSEMTVLCSDDAEKRDQLAKQYNLIPYSYDEFDKMLDNHECDALYIATPNFLHINHVVPALEKGYHVLCEKLMGCSVEECETMMAAQKKSGAKLMIAYRLHCDPGNLEVLERVRKGDFGDPRIFISMHTQNLRPDNHRAKYGFDCGPVPDMGPYPINGSRTMFGDEPIEVQAMGLKNSEHNLEMEYDTVAVNMKFPRDRVASFVVGYSTVLTTFYRIIGTQGEIIVDPAFNFDKAVSYTTRFGEGGEDEKKKNFPKVDQFGGETEYFSDCILKNIEPEPNGEEGLLDTRVVYAIKKSLETGKPVKLEPYNRLRRAQMDQVRSVSFGKPPKQKDVIGRDSAKPGLDATPDTR
ncbi:unnamed protein product [Rotaria sordida]|uniref:Uncharacterized protein n=1 Tax=Rotaria sordida TaxID=392033 RepID=A0A813XMH0_9BILA|nr:unnamed protein product [Rotaria sordida]CAF0895521.1 unnamed protein product [Rotaria sordida]